MTLFGFPLLEHYLPLRASSGTVNWSLLPLFDCLKNVWLCWFIEYRNRHLNVKKLFDKIHINSIFILFTWDWSTLPFVKHFKNLDYVEVTMHALLIIWNCLLFWAFLFIYYFLVVFDNKDHCFIDILNPELPSLADLPLSTYSFIYSLETIKPNQIEVMHISGKNQW